MNCPANITTAARTPNRRVTRFTKVIVGIILAPFLAAMIAGTTIGIIHAIEGDAKPQVTDQVTSFNDGFADSKKDDCDQGFKAACAWLQQQGLPQ